MSLRITAAQQRYASVQGFIEAMARHDAAEGLRPTFISLAEALFWAATVDESRRKEPWYEPAREVHADGIVMPGIRYARNFATHQIVALTEAGPGGLTIPFTIPFTIPTERTLWLPFEDLPDPQQRSKHTPAQQQAYRDHLAGQPTVTTLLRVQSWLQDVYEHD